VPSSRPPSDAARSVRSVAEFLSDEWIAALDTAAHAAPDVGADAADVFAVEPVVRGVPGRGDVRYRVTCDTVVRAVTRPPDGEPADVRIETDYTTAVALARGELNAQTALADGLLRVSGDLARLASHAAALARLGDLFGSVRATTTFGSAEPEA
jgi:SCP-2 sterol transfer family protein